MVETALMTFEIENGTRLGFAVIHGGKSSLASMVGVIDVFNLKDKDAIIQEKYYELKARVYKASGIDDSGVC